MATINPARVRRIPGRLAWGCTDLTAVWPHGGTGLGNVRGIVVRQERRDFIVTAEEFGFEPVERIQGGEVYAVAAILRDEDDDMLSKVFPNTAAGTTTQRRVVSTPGSVRAGALATARGGVLVFTPEGATHAKSATAPDVDADFFVLYRALPAVEESAEVQRTRDADVGLPVVFLGVRDSSGRIAAQGHRADLSLA